MEREIKSVLENIQITTTSWQFGQSKAYFMNRNCLRTRSESFKARNPHLYAMRAGKATYRAEALRRRGIMNQTEAEYAVILKGLQGLGQIHRFEFEGITLRWAGMRYTPDFVVFSKSGEDITGIKLIEVKGTHIWSRDVVRFKGARAYWPEFQFEMWCKTKSGWKQRF